MRKIFTLLVMLISLGLTSEIIATNNQVVAKSTGCTSIDGKGVATFVVTSPQAQVCDLSFLMMPGEYEDGSFTSVTLKVNGVTLPNPITFSTYGWQSANTTGNAVSLNKGDNTIQFISGRDDVPMIREIKVWDGRRMTYPIQRNIDFSNNVKENGNKIDTRYIDGEGNQYINPEEPLSRSGVKTDMKYYYTTTIDIYYEQKYDSEGDPIPIIANFYAPTSWDPVFGQYESTVDYNAYLFYKSDPTVYSKRFSTTNHSLYCQDTIPVAGEYCLILEPKTIKEEGWASIRINNSNLYRNCYISQDTIIEVKRKDLANNIVVSAQDSIYNMFTVSNCSIDSTASHTPDPVLWLKQRVVNGPDTSDIIVAYSDTNTVNSYFDWGKNARIRTKLDSTKQYFLTLSSMLPYIQSTNPDVCDLYHSYWNSVDSTVNSKVKGENVIYEDFIESGKAVGLYNCIAWSAGINYNLIGTTDLNMKLLDDLFNNKSIRVPENIINVKRPPKSPIYTRENATFENAVVDIWGIITENNDTIIKHASVRNPYSGIPNGYDWESKCGDWERIFHPRMADLGYGQIIAHYTLAPGQDTVKYSYEGIVYSSVAEGEMIIEDVQLTEEEKSLLSQKSSTTYRLNKFEQYYTAWKEYVKMNLYHSSMEMYKDTVAYPRLINYILSNPGEEYKAYKKFDDGDYFTAVLIKDISTINGTTTKKIWENIMQTPPEDPIERTFCGYIRLFIKTMLQDEEIDTLPQTGKIRSNEDDVEIIAINGGVSITVGLDKVSKYSINAVNVQTTQQFVLLPESSHNVGKETYQYSLTSGTYIIAVIVDGNINAQKVIIK